jgi:hypothetical protein
MRCLPVDIFIGRYGVGNSIRIDCFDRIQWQLNDNPMNQRITIELFNLLNQLCQQDNKRCDDDMNKQSTSLPVVR